MHEPRGAGAAKPRLPGPAAGVFEEPRRRHQFAAGRTRNNNGMNCSGATLFFARRGDGGIYRQGGRDSASGEFALRDTEGTYGWYELVDRNIEA